MKEKLSLSLSHTIDIIRQKSKAAYEGGKEKVNRLSRKQLLSIGAGVMGIMVVAVAIGVVATNADDQKDLQLADKDDENASWVITVDGQTVLGVATMKDGSAVLDGIRAYYQTAGSEIVSIDFVENVVLEAKTKSVAEDVVETADVSVMNVEDAISYILTGSKEPITYLVQGGDNLWDIAAKNQINIYELQEMNPQLEADKLSIGQEIYLYKTNPFVTVQLTEIVTATERIEYDTVYESSNSIYKGQTKVQTAGVYGSKDIKTQVVKQNGVVVASALVDEVITVQPQSQVTLKGTQTIAISGGSGILSAPLASIEVSSAFGSRGGGRHLGVDLRAPRGTPIYASDAGTVIYAQYSGSYGNIIKIDHGGGLQTYYAHCDSMSVSVGNVVAKGQAIGTLGSTGNATGDVLHFEVRVNGAAQNPMNYL